MRKLILAALLAVLLLPVRVQAQSVIHFSAVRVEVWPEFDKPAVLVIYHITLAPDVALPAAMTVRIPVKENAVAYLDASGALLQLIYESKVEGGWTLLTFTAPTDSIQVEYYDTLVTDGAARHVVYQWPGDYATDSLIINFLQPLDATDLKLDPEPVSNKTDANGLVQYQIDFLSRAVGETATLTADYQKTTDRLSASLPQVQPSAPLDNNAQGKVTLSALLPWLVGGVGFLLIVFGLMIGLNYWRGTGQKSGERKRHAAARHEEEGDTDQAYYCPQCGKRAQPADQFCRTCGARLRRDE
jgi:hypothetical protein